MNCNAYEPALGEYVDGTLPLAATATIEAHLASCPGCRALADDLLAIRGAARMLERHEPPSRTWHRIAAAVEDDRRTRPLGWLAWRPLAAAAAIVLAAVGPWFLPVPTSPPDDVVQVAEAGSPPDGESAEANFQTAIAGLERIADADGSALDPMTAEILRTNLTVIDGAIGESRAALETEPASDVAQQRLVAALTNKLALLQDTVALINEVRQGEQNP
jgi:anti-sigma factor RsiW